MGGAFGCSSEFESIVGEVGLGEPVAGTGSAQLERFERGRELALRRFGPADGIGPHFSAVSCHACHEKPVTGGGASRYRDVFVRAGAGFSVEFQAQFVTDDRALLRTPDGVSTSVRTPIPLFGMGLLAQIPADVILERNDPNDYDGDGISGRVNFERGFVARFGRKAQIAALDGFVQAALADHLGITTNPVDLGDLLPEPAPAALPVRDDDDVTDPELGEDDLRDLLTFVVLLGPPAVSEPTQQSEWGRSLFLECGCDGCHVPALESPAGPVFAYSDLLLHDMGEALADGVQVGEASPQEFRTQPLWGLSIAGPYLHDGRADTIEDAIEWHGGEASASAACLSDRSGADRRAVVAFLAALGGESYRADGLLPLDAEIPRAGMEGGPLHELSARELERFANGRALFDLDFAIAQGLGPRFNGDSCRSCHFDPVIGGAGPSDVDVIRYGSLIGRQFQPPPTGTVAHRHATSGQRPPIDADANLFERRQTPTVLGAGLIDRIAPEAILASADPHDSDGDGIRGRPHILADGRLGRFGWKAQVPTLADFARDALAVELGVTVASATPYFGRSRDDDLVDDPELSQSSFSDLVFFMQHLAPPVRTYGSGGMPEPVRRGDEVFRGLGCDRCHTPRLPTEDGLDVELYSDLLLHDVSAADRSFVPEGDATRQFRTPPLWGLASTSPYMHDGSASYIEDAIEMHDAEALTSRLAYEALGAAQRADLIAFLRSL
jgi:CxxC motif-containing protein (DUF1111 family)